ncbi:hypothetical protein MRX96_040983 [Rhipicephalus microplus]
MLDYWISERLGNAALIGGSTYFEDKRLPHGSSKDPFSYDSILDTVSLSMVAVHDRFTTSTTRLSVRLTTVVWAQASRMSSWKASKTTPRCVTPGRVTHRTALTTETTPHPGVLRPAAILLVRSGLSSV